MAKNSKNLVAELKTQRKKVHEKCLGLGFQEAEKKFLLDKKDNCSRIERTAGEINEDCVCSTYVDPSVFWNRGGCPMADHYRPDLFVEAKEVRRVGQQKQKKKK